jgi:hypothetical protein
MDLKEILILDAIDPLPDGLQIRCHDLHGPLPVIAMENSGDTFKDKDRLGNEVCKIIAMVKLRDEMIRFLPGCKLLPLTSMDGKVIVDLQTKSLTWLGEGKDFLTAYHVIFPSKLCADRIFGLYRYSLADLETLFETWLEAGTILKGAAQETMAGKPAH